MDDWSFARPLPPGSFPDEDHRAGARDVAKQPEPNRNEQPEPLPAN
jgi:hypothetical protein